MAQVLPIPTRRRERRRARRPVAPGRLVFPTADGEDRVCVRPASGGGPWVWLSARTIYGESLQTADLLLDRRRLRAVARLLARAARQLARLPDVPAHAIDEEYRAEVACRVAEEWYAAERGGIELPEDY